MNRKMEFILPLEIKIRVFKILCWNELRFFVFNILYRTYEGIIVKVVKDIPNPYAKNPKFERRFIFTLNKIHGWSLTEYERVVMLDVDNVFLRAPDELFQCGEFCAAFINPCIFHTGLFVLKVETFYVFDIINQ